MAEEKTKKPAFKFTVNEARGEARLVIDNVELVLAATMHGLANLSSRLQCKSLNDLFLRLSAVEISATQAAIETLALKGDTAAALDRLRLKHFADCGVAFSKILAHHFEGEEGNAEAADEAA